MSVFVSRAPSAARAPRTQHQVLPHTTERSVLERQASIYRQGKTPVMGPGGAIVAGDSRPGSGAMAGAHLGEIAARFGDRGLRHSVAGLARTRGHAFASVAVHAAPASVRSRAAARVQGALDQSGPRSAATAQPTAGSDASGVGAGVASQAARRAIADAGSGHALPEPYRSRLGALAGASLDDVRLHDSPAGHEAARLLNARAFTVGRSIYLGAGQYRPSTADGLHLLAHETAHAVQQQGAAAAALPHGLAVEAPGSRLEQEADRFADAATRRDRAGPRLSAGAVRAARVMRVIGFTGTAAAPTKIDPTAAENAAGTHLQIAAGTPPGPYFDWDGSYTITGNAGDPFANFRIFPAQVTRSVHENVSWGTGADRTTRRLRIPTPARDSTAGSVHYHDPAGSAAFGAAGDVRASNLNDTPGTPAAVTPFANPVPPRGGTRGWFNWGMAFVAYFGARDTTVAGAAGFRPLNFCYWNLSVDGNWDTTRALGARVNANGRTNLGPVSSGASAEFPPMFGGDATNTLINDPANVTTT